MSDEKTEEQLATEALQEGISKLKEEYSVKSALVAMINDYAMKAVTYKGNSITQGLRLNVIFMQRSC